MPTRFDLVAMGLVCLALGAPTAARAQPGRGRIFAIAAVDGPEQTGRLVRTELPWTFVFDVDGEEVAFRAEEIVAISVIDPPRSGTETGTAILLANGDQLNARTKSASEDALAAESDLLGPLSVPLETIRAIALAMPEDHGAGSQLLRRMSDPKVRQDVVYLTNGDSLAGTLVAIDEQTIELESTVGNVSVQRSGVAAIGMNPELTSMPPAEGLRALVRFADGSRVTVQSIAWNSGHMRLAAQYGGTIEVEPNAVVAMQFFGGRVEYLSDIEPVALEHTPFLSLSWPLQRDSSVAGNPLRLRGQSYAKGLGVHSASRVTYRLDGRYQRFEAVAGIDDETGGGGSVVFRVLVDGKERFASSVVRGNDEPVTVGPIDLTGADELVLVVEYADRADVQDHADWANARLVK